MSDIELDVVNTEIGDYPLFPLRTRLNQNRKIWYDKTWVYATFFIFIVIIVVFILLIKILFFSHE